MRSNHEQTFPMKQNRKIQSGTAVDGNLGDITTSTPGLIDEGVHPRHRHHSEHINDSDGSDNDDEMKQIFEMQKHKQQYGETMKMASQLRRTPGANTMHRSAFEQLKTQSLSSSQGNQMNTPLIRRTPGASAMHRSSRTYLSEAYDKERDDNRSESNNHNGANAIEFGLPLSTPVARSQNKFLNRDFQKSTPPSQSAVDTRTPRFQNSKVPGPGSSLKPPLPKNNGVSLYTPAGVALARNQNLNLRTPGTFSPNTFQLATALDDLLDDEDDDSLDNPISPRKGIGSAVNTSHTSHNESILSLQKTSSFGAESNISGFSGVSSCLSSDSIDIDSFTLDTSKDINNRSLLLSAEKRSNKDTNGSRLHSSYVQNQFRTLDNSYTSDASIHSANKTNKSVTLLPTDSGAFSSPRKSPGRDTSAAFIHVPTPQRYQSSPNQTQQIQQHRMKEENNLDLDSKKSQVQNRQQFHHYGTIPPQYNIMDSHPHPASYNMGYDASLDLYRYQQHLHPHSHPHPHPNHHTMPFQNQVPMMNNHNIGYPHHLHHLPPSMSPLTLPTFPTDLRHDVSSPVPFINHQPSLGWTEQGRNWGHGWDHHSQNQQYDDFNGARFYGRGMNHMHAPSPPPPQMQHTLYQVPNQQMRGPGYHRNDETMHHTHQSARHINDGRNNQEQYQPGFKQKLRNKKKVGNKFEMEIHLKENRKVVHNLRKDDESDIKDSDEIWKGTKMKQTKKFLKKDDYHPQVKKKVPNDIGRKSKKDHLPQIHSRDAGSNYNEGDVKNGLTQEELVADQKKSELIETPAIRALFKEFYREYRAQEKISLEAAATFATQCLQNEEYPTSVHWRIYLELADLSKRANKFYEARELFNRVCSLQPYASQGWLEYSKLEEESGNLTFCSTILNRGLHYCENNEHLLIRAIKHEEKLAQEQGHNDLSRARALLAPLKELSIDKIWKVVLEGALMEARAGFIVEARNILNHLMHYIPWYGPLYLEAFRLERDSEEPLGALVIVERGLKEIPRYGPLWFGAFRLCEGLDVENKDFHLPRTLEMIDRAIGCISRELIWKVHLEAAQALERAAHLSVETNKNTSLAHALTESRKRFVMTIGTCPVNLRWKVWLAAGRMELSAGRFEEARKIFLKSYAVVPDKGRNSVLLECARLEEFIGDTKLAKAILCKCRSEEGNDWKVWLQSVNLAIRNGDRHYAIRLAVKGLEEHSGTGRLWAALVQLREEDGKMAQMKTLNQALHAVPKSGEVWCEGARIFLNPLSVQYDLDTASRHLEFATKFTPQYGDSFIETLRLELVQKTLISKYQSLIDDMKSKLGKLLEGKENEDDEVNVYNDQFLKSFIKTLSLCIQNAASTIQAANTNSTSCSPSSSSSITTTSLLNSVDTSKLELSCSNADPNYGKLWFHCRTQPSDTAKAVMKKAKDIIIHNLGRYGYFYVIAFMRSIAIEMLIHYETLFMDGTCCSDGDGRESGTSTGTVIGIGTDSPNKDEDEESKIRQKWIELIPSLKSLLLYEGGYMNHQAEKIINNQNKKEIIKKGEATKTTTDVSDDVKLLERDTSIHSSNFTTGIYELNDNIILQDIPLMERRKILFGSDLLL